MTFNSLKRILIILPLAMAFMSSVALADDEVIVGEDGESITITDAMKDSSHFEVTNIFSSEDEQTSADLIEEGKREGISAVAALILKAINILSLLIGTFGFVMLMISGFLAITSNGNETQIDKAKAMIGKSIVGVILAFLSYFIVQMVQSLLYS